MEKTITLERFRAVLETVWKNRRVRGLIVGLWAAGLLVFENRRALRKVRRSKVRRDTRNLAIAIPAGAVMQALESPIALKLARFAEAKRWGALPRLPLPAPLATLAGVLLLDYTLYWWHYLTHRVPLLWRFHQVHHLDQEMDVTTGLRFHFGEITASVLFRALQITLLGPTPATVTTWQLFLFLCVLFHHSNVRLPLALERRLARILVTPRLHGIHHSIIAEEVNSNWSSGLSVWDWLHATLRTDATQDALTLGVSGLQSDNQDGVTQALALPFHGAAHPPRYDGLPVRQPLTAIR